MTSLVQKHLHITNKDCENFTNEKEEVFHSVVAKLLWITKKARLNLETSASSHARELRKVIMIIGKIEKSIVVFVKITIGNIRTIAADDLSKVYTLIDAVYTIHNGTRSHIGGAM